MKKIKQRIAFHFSLHFFIMVLFISTVLLAALFLLIEFIVKEEVHRDFPVGMLETIATDTVVEGENTEIRQSWQDQIKENDMWLQIVNLHGEVLYEVNGTNQLPKKYSNKEIMDLEMNKSFGEYQVATLVESMFYDEPYYFILGFQDEKQQLLLDWMDRFNHETPLSNRDEIRLENEINQFEGYYLDIIDHEGNVRHRIGSSAEPLQYNELQVTAQLKEPHKYGATLNVKQSGTYLWILHAPLNKDQLGYTFIHQVLLVLTGIGVIIFILLLVLAVSHAIRYGQPLILFISWLERMRNEEYDLVFTEKEKKKLFTKKNEVKRRYRLYKEVIQEFYKMTEQLASVEKERAQLEERREEWMAGISHDLRTPLSTIQGYGHLLESSQYEWKDTELIEIGETIRKKSHYMLELIQDFSLFTKLKDKKFPIEFSKIDLEDILHNCTAKYNEQTILQTDIPEIPLFIMEHSKWLERLLDNVIINAIKHNPTNTIITLTARMEENYILLTVADDGMGMDEETKQNLFTRYYRGTRSEELTDGSGLGMSIANAIVQAHHGIIQVDSKLNHGTTITLKFPKFD